MGIEAVIARALQVLLALGGAYLVALWFVLIVWAYRDIETRSRNVLTQILSTLLVVLFWVPGALLYLMLRPKETLDSAFQRSLEEEYLLQDLEELPHCPTCERFVEEDFVLCPHCHTRLREPCIACARLVDLRWSICPYCGAAQGGEAAQQPERVEAPAARWRRPLRTRRTAEEAVAASSGASRRDDEEDRPRVASATDADEASVAAAEERTAPVMPAPDVATGAVLPEPIPLVPMPRGRFRRPERATPVPVNGRAADSEQVSAGGLFTSILGSRGNENGRTASASARARRAARLSDRAAERDLAPVGTRRDTRQPEPGDGQETASAVPARAEGQGD